MSMSDDLQPGVLYLKVRGNALSAQCRRCKTIPDYINIVRHQVFKNVDHTDIDLLLPGAEAKFNWLDCEDIYYSIYIQ